VRRAIETIAALGGEHDERRGKGGGEERFHQWA
jgi:hypothetical protein